MIQAEYEGGDVASSPLRVYHGEVRGRYGVFRERDLRLSRFIVPFTDTILGTRSAGEQDNGDEDDEDNLFRYNFQMDLSL